MMNILRFQWKQVINTRCSSFDTLGLFVLLMAFALEVNSKEVAMPVPIKVSGRVLSQDDNSGIPGANILIKGTILGTVTDTEGRFSIEAPDDAVLVISYVGYTTQEVPIRGRTVIDVTLSPDDVELGEIIVVGYGTSRKKDLTGSVARISTEDIDAIPVYNIEQALNGRAPGVTVQQNSGAPGGRLEVRIRGGNSMIGSNEPLYVVDGIAMTGPIDFINPTDVESIDILKDASATAIYGTRGANGVVIITTKRGSKGEIGKIEVNSFYGVQKEINRYEMLNIDQFIEVANERAFNDGVPQLIDPDTVSSAGTDWQDLIFRSATVQSHTITFSGGGKATRYSFATNYFQQDGLIINTGVKRGNVRFNLDHEVNKRITFGFNANLGRREVNRLNVDNGNLGGTIYADAMAMPPTLSGPFDNDGQFYQIEQMPEYTWVSLDVRNPLIYGERKDRILANSVVANSYLDITLMEGLKFKTIWGLEYNNSIDEFFTPIIYSADMGSAGDGYNYRNSFLNENILSYTKSFAGQHQLNVIGGFTMQNYMSRFANARVTGISNNATENFDLAAASIINPPTNGISEWSLLSWLGRANYTFKDKYLFTASVRTDGSSRFGKANQWAVFPSVAAGWRISEESFLQSAGFIDDLKLRASYGVTGNTALNPYQSLDRLASVRVVQGGMTDQVGYIPSALANQDLQWETTRQLNIGFDLSVLNNKLGITLDYYTKNTDNLLASVPLPPSVGFTSSLQNIGKIENKGFELAINAVLLDSKFKWSINGQVSTNQNKVTELAGNNDIFGSANSHPFNATINIAREGYPLGMFFGLLEDGLDDKGFVKYKDIDGNGVINALDRVILGNPYPEITYGLNNTISYGNFELNFFIQGVQGRDLFWETAGVFLNSFQRGMNQFADLHGNYWTQDNPNPNAKYPKISSQTTQQVSDRYVFDASFMRLKLIRLAYNVPVHNINWLSRAQVFVAGTNLLTLTDYPGLDPEVNTTGTDSNAIGPRLRVGIDETAYPTPKMVTLGINLGF